MAKIVDYVVLTSSKGVENLETLIKQNINLGWQPIGGVAVITPNTESDLSVTASTTFVQAMVLYDN